MNIQKGASVLATIVAATGCGTKPPARPIEHTMSAVDSQSRRGDAAVLFAAGHGSFTPLACVRDGARQEDCAPVTAALRWSGAELRDPGGARWRITGTQLDGCGYEVEELTAVSRGPVADDDDDDDDEGLSVIPADAEIGYRDVPGGREVEVAPDTARALAHLASRFLDEVVDPDDVYVAQSVSEDFDGDGTPDRLYAASATSSATRAPDDSTWQSLVYLPHGAAARAIEILPSRRDVDYVLRGSFDLEGDGRREVYFVIGDDDSERMGVLSFIGGVPTLVASVPGC